jgi:hypothetical protein
MTTAEFEQIVKDWIATAKHPKFKRPYTECVYQPMVELLAYLRANGFQDFHRLWWRHRVHAPMDGKKSMASRPSKSSAAVSKRSVRVARRQARAHAVAGDELYRRQDRQTGRHQFTHWPPSIAAFGNSDGDQQMLEWTQAGSGARLMMLVHHDDATREFALRLGVEDRHVLRRADGRGEEE